MIAKNYMELPTEGLTRGCVLDEGNAITVYLDAHEEVRQVPDGNPEEGRVKDETVRVGYAVRCLKPFSEDRAVDAAIQTAFGLRDGEVSRFNADMAIKIADGSDDATVVEYKGFVKWLRLELAKALGTMDALTAAKEQKIAEIDAYDQSEAVNGFTLNGAVVWLDKATRVGLMNSTNIAKASGSANTTLWLGGERMVVPCDKAIQLLSALEMYALGCFNVTAAHKKAVSELTTLDEVLAYDYTNGYPEQLKMEV